VSDIPHFWKERDIRSHFTGTPTKCLAFGLIGILVTAKGGHLK
jgi:hypothetical protein